MPEKPHPAEDAFYGALRPYFPPAGTAPDIALAVGLPMSAAPLIMGVYEGRIVPSFPFIENLVLFVEIKRNDRPPRLTGRGIVGGAGRLAELELLHTALLDALGIPPDHGLRNQDHEVVWFYNLYDNTIDEFQTSVSLRARTEAIRAERGRETRATQVFRGDLTGTSGAKTDRRMRAERGPRPLEHARPVELWEDAPGHALKPDPMTAQNLPELLESLRKFWRWADKPGMRQLEERSGRVFSKSTVAKLIHGGSGSQTPPLSQKYVAGIIRGCGGDDNEVARWVTAFRLLDIAEQAAPRASVTMMRRRKAQ